LDPQAIHFNHEGGSSRNSMVSQPRKPESVHSYHLKFLKKTRQYYSPKDFMQINQYYLEMNVQDLQKEKCVFKYLYFLKYPQFNIAEHVKALTFMEIVEENVFSFGVSDFCNSLHMIKV
jgi:hypothetical protein